MAVYDDEKTSANDLHGITGISKAEAADMEARATAGADQDQDQAAANDEQKSLFNDDRKPQGFKALFKGRRRKAGIGLAATGVTGGIIGLFMFTLPLKVVHMVTNIQDRFYASAEQASEDMIDNLLRHYIVQQLVPGMIANNCTTTRVSKSCANTSTSSTIVGVLYNSWRDGRLEEKLANNHGIEIRREGNRFFLYTPNAGRVDLGNYNSADFNDKAFQELSRNELRREIRRGFEAESFSKRIMYRYSVGGLLERKYGVRRCITACQTRDKISDKIDVKKNAFKSYLVERVVMPRNEILGVAMQCAIGGFSCTETPSEADENGERRSEFEQNTQARLSELRANYGQEGLDELDRQAEEFRDEGMVDVAVEKLIGKAQADILKKTVPVIGWLDLGVTMINAAQNAGPAITKIAYVTNTTTAVAMFQLYRTSADEIKTGEVDAAVIGSVNDSLNPNPSNDQGGGGAEKSPIYDDIMGNTQLSYASSSVFAAEEVSAYTCDDGSRPKKGELCPEETVGNVNGKASAVANALSNYTNSPMFKVALGPGAAQGIQGWTTFVSPIVNAIGALGGDAADGVLSLIPGYDGLKDKTKEIAGGVAKTFSTWLVPSPISNKPSGGRNINLAIVGGDVSGNEFTHYGLGGKKIPDQEAYNIQASRKSADQIEFQKRSWVARTFDTDSQYSFVSRTAMSLPSSTTSAQQTFASVLSDPFRTLSSLFTGLFQPPAVLAQNNANYHDPAGVTQYGYDSDDPVFTGDPDAAWKNLDCDNPETKKKWGEKGTLNPDTQQIEHTTTNPCALIRSAVSSAGGKYNTDLLENPQTASGGENADDTPAAGELVSGEAKELAKKILDSPNVSGDSRYMDQIKKVADGDDSCHVNKTILGLIVTISEKYKIYITSLNRRCTGVLTASGEGSYHYRDQGGHALDIGSVDGLPSTGGTSKDRSLLKSVLPLLPQGSGIGQQNCRSSAISLPQGVTQFNDSCNHIHIQVPTD